MYDILFLTIIITVCFCECTTKPAQNVYVDASDNVALQCSVENITLASWLGPCESHLSYCRSSIIRYFIGFAKSPHIESTVTPPIKVYVDVADNVTLRCSVDNFIGALWFGPLEPNFTTIVYFDGLNKSPNVVGKSISLRINGSRMTETLSYDLYIRNIASKYIGNYTCSEVKEGITTTTKYQILLKVKPRNIFIENSTQDGRLIGREGQQVALVCSVTSGIPKENISWSNEQDVVKTGGPGTLQHSFLANCSDHGRTFTCKVHSETLQEPLKQKVTLDIQYKPRVSVGERNMSVIEGAHFTVRCMSDSNPPTSLIQIKRGDFVLKTCSTPSCNWTRNSSRRDSGRYMCTAQNEEGEGSEQYDVNVLFDDTKEEKNGNSITYFIGISVGSSIIGALSSLIFYRCCQKVRKRSFSNIAPTTNINSDIEVQYKEIDDGHLHEMEEIPVNLRQQVTNRPTNPTIEAETENENRNTFSINNVAIEVQYNEIGGDILHEMSNRLVPLRHQDINRPANSEIVAEPENANLNVIYANTVVKENKAGLDTVLSDDNSNSDSSSDKPRNSYINVPQSAGNQYQSLEGGKSGDIEDSSYDQLNAGNRLEALYHNLRI